MLALYKANQKEARDCQHYLPGFLKAAMVGWLDSKPQQVINLGVYPKSLLRATSDINTDNLQYSPGSYVIKQGTQASW